MGNQELTTLRHFSRPEAPGVIKALAVAFPADALSEVVVYGVQPYNRSVICFQLGGPGGGEEPENPRFSTLLRGDREHARDGPLSEARVHRPGLLLWSGQDLLLTDGCALRSVSGLGGKDLSPTQDMGSRVETLLAPRECGELAALNETLLPLPWESKLSELQALAAGDSSTRRETLLMLTEAQVLQVDRHRHGGGSPEKRSACAAAIAEEGGKPATEAKAKCMAASETGHACGWGSEESPGKGQACFACEDLRDWATTQWGDDAVTGQIDMCVLEYPALHGGFPGGETHRLPTSYDLGQCGCVAPKPSPDDPGSGGAEEEDGGISIGTAFICVLVFVLMGGLGALAYRRGIRIREWQGLRESYGVDTSEFYTFSDDPHC